MKTKIKKILLAILFMSLFTLPAFAEKISVRISPIKLISTNKDEIEVGDKIPFQVVNDVYVNRKLYIKKNTLLVGIVDFVHPNGWAGDNAQITFKNFQAKNINNEKIKISYPLTIEGGMETGQSTKQIIGYFLTYLFRGAEIYVEPDTKVYNIFIEME